MQVRQPDPVESLDKGLKGRPAADMNHFGDDSLDLPHVTSPLVARAVEVDEITKLLTRPDGRLVSLVGAPGAGKTRVAIAVAQAQRVQFANGVRFVDLAAVDTPELAISTLAHALGLRPTGDRPLVYSLAAVLHDQELLVVLDNFEQVLTASGQVLDLLVACPHLRVLITSREPLHVAAEQLVEIRPLAVPDLDHLPEDLADLAAVPSVALFQLRARLTAPEFTLTAQNARAVAEVCVRLDGLPLAIELAATWGKVLPPRALLDQLEHGLQLLVTQGSEIPARHRALQLAIAVSYDRLSPDEQTLLCRLAVFSGGCSPQTVLAVTSCSDEQHLPALLRTIGALHDKHLIQISELADGAPRYSLLETVRQFAWERLVAAGEAAELRRSHALAFCDLAERVEHELTSNQKLWLDLLERERDNLRAAITWAQEQAEMGQPEIGLRLVAALWLYWDLRGHAREGRARAERMVQASSTEQAGSLYSAALLTVGWLAWVMGDFASAHAVVQKAFAVAVVEGKQIHQARALVIQALGIGHTTAMHDPEARARARAMYEESMLLAGSSDPWSFGFCLYGLGHLAELAGDHAGAQEVFTEAYLFCERAGSQWGMSFAQFRRGRLALLAGDIQQARSALTDSVRLSLAVDDPRSLSLPLEALAVMAAGYDQPEQAARLFGAAETQLVTADFPLPGFAQAIHDKTVAQLRKRLNPGVFAAAWAAGRNTPRQHIPALLAEQEDLLATMPTGEGRSKLSARERDVVRLIAAGLTNRQIAQGLSITEKTVNAHIERIFNKLGVRSRAQAAVWAARHGLTSPVRESGGC